MYLESIHNAVAKDDLQGALNLLSELAAGSTHVNEVIAQRGRLSRQDKQGRLGIVSYEEVNVDRAKLRLAILDLATELETIAKDDPLVSTALAPERPGPIYQQRAEKIYNIDKIEGGANFS